MFKHWINRFSPILLLLACTLLIINLLATFRSDAQASTSGGEVQTGLVPRFIDFDIGAATVRSGAEHQDESTGIPDIPPYVLLPNSGFPLTIVNFTVPPDFDIGGDFDARLVVNATFIGNTFPCFFVLETELVGYGPGHSAALFSPYWADETSTSVEYILQASDVSLQELPITFQATNGFPNYPGDVMAFTLWRDANNVNDTCGGDVMIRSISFTYQGLTSYLPFVQN